MIFFNAKHKNIKRTSAIFVLLFFFLSSLAGAAEPALCFDDGKVHVFDQNLFSLVSCHPTNDIQSADGTSSSICFISETDTEKACVDIALNYCDSSMSSHQGKKPLRKLTPAIFVTIYQASLVKQSNKNALAPQQKTLPVASSLSYLQTIVLLI